MQVSYQSPKELPSHLRRKPLSVEEIAVINVRRLRSWFFWGVACTLTRAQTRQVALSILLQKPTRKNPSNHYCDCISATEVLCHNIAPPRRRPSAIFSDQKTNRVLNIRAQIERCYLLSIDLTTYTFSNVQIASTVPTFRGITGGRTVLEWAMCSRRTCSASSNHREPRSGAPRETTSRNAGASIGPPRP